MDTQQPQHDLDDPPTDPAFDALLDQAVAHGSPAADPDLTERIFHQTQPLLTEQRPVLMRIGPSLFRAAAAIALVAGCLALFHLNTPTDSPTHLANHAEPVDTLSTGLAELDQAMEPGNTVIEQQLDVLALRISLASTDDAWGDEEGTTDERIDRAVAEFDFDRFSDDVAFALADETSWF